MFFYQATITPNGVNRLKSRLKSPDLRNSLQSRKVLCVKTTYYVCPKAIGKCCDWADWEPVVTVVVVRRVDVATVEVEVTGVVGIVRVERTWPIVAVRTMVVEVIVVAVTRSRDVPTTVTWYTQAGKCFLLQKPSAKLCWSYYSKSSLFLTRPKGPCKTDCLNLPDTLQTKTPL